MTTKHAVSITSVLALSGALLLAGCANDSADAPAAGPMPVEVLTVRPEAVTLSEELPGRISAHRVAEVRARISGIVLKRLFTEGADVREGEVLFQIDPAPYEAALDSAKATLARAEAGLVSAQAQAERFKGLVESNAVSRQNYDDAESARLGYVADVAAAKAAVRTAEINLGYTNVTSPISGRIGRAEVTEGAYVQQGTATLLATVQQLDPLYVDLSRPAEEVIRLKQALASGRLVRAGENDARFTLVLADGTEYGHGGSLQFSDVSVNTSTGTVMLRGLIPNPEQDLLPGMFVRARLVEGTSRDAILIPQSLVSRNTKGEPTAMVVGADDKAEVRPLQVSRTVGNRWLVIGGLSEGDRVITDNLQKLRPGVPVQPVVPPVATAR